MNKNIKYGCYGHKYNVRKDYEKLPFQWFWTWITGKGLPLDDEDLKKAKKRPSESFLLAHLFFTWFLIISSVYLGILQLKQDSLTFSSYLIIFLSMIIIVNRFRSLQATFHYLTHNTMMNSKKKQKAKIYSILFITTPMLYIDWDSYIKTHVQEHHNLNVLCTNDDPDQIFVKKQGIKKGMSEKQYWFKALFNSFRPKYLLNDWITTIKDVLVQAPLLQKIYSVFFWTSLLVVLYKYEILGFFLFMYMVPRLFLFPHSMWLQLFTEHLWLKTRDESISSNFDKKIDYGKLTWGRFQGRPIPKNFFGKITWLVQIFLKDIPVRLYIYPQDLPNHDFHHRMPNINYKNIANVRATLELDDKAYGNYYEVWGFWNSLKLIRDHLCHKRDDLFS